MIWYYMDSQGQQTGPIGDAEFSSLVQSGTVKIDTMVWREGLPAWVRYGDAGPATGGAMEQCSECGRRFSTDEMILLEGSRVCANCKPLFVQKIREGAKIGTFGSGWRSGKRLVMPVNTELPQRCIKCNAPTEGNQIRRKLYWHHPALYFALLLRVIPYLIVALIFRKKSVNFISVCQQHRSARRLALVTTWVVFLGGVGLLIYGCANLDNHGIPFLWTGIGLMVAGIVYGILRARYVYATRITKEYIWMGGCSREFLAEFPEWTGPNS